jgi:hypothetical protein
MTSLKKAPDLPFSFLSRFPAEGSQEPLGTLGLKKILRSGVRNGSEQVPRRKSRFDGNNSREPAGLVAGPFHTEFLPTRRVRQQVGPSHVLKVEGDSLDVLGRFVILPDVELFIDPERTGQEDVEECVRKHDRPLGSRPLEAILLPFDVLDLRMPLLPGGVIEQDLPAFFDRHVDVHLRAEYPRSGLQEGFRNVVSECEPHRLSFFLELIIVVWIDSSREWGIRFLRSSSLSLVVACCCLLLLVSLLVLVL